MALAPRHSKEAANKTLIRPQSSMQLIFGINVMALRQKWWRKRRRNISINIPLDLSIPTEMTCIEPLVENEKSSKTPNKLKNMLCYIFSD